MKKKGKRKGRPCTLCGRTSSDDFYPFCSDRCRLIDLGRWLDETYRIIGDETTKESEKEENS